VLLRPREPLAELLGRGAEPAFDGPVRQAFALDGSGFAWLDPLTRVAVFLARLIGAVTGPGLWRRLPSGRAGGVSELCQSGRLG